MLAQLPSDKVFEVLPKLSLQQAWFALAFLVLIVGYFVVRHALAPGSQTLAARQTNTKDIAAVLQDQITDLKGERTKLEAALEVMEEAFKKSEKERVRLDTIYNTNSTQLRIRADEIDAAREVPAMSGMARILVVDDNADARTMLQMQLFRLGYAVHIAAKAQRALKLCIDAATQNQPYDLILLDESMPEMSGQAFMTALRAMGDNTRIIFITGHADKHGGQCLLDGKTAKELDAFAIVAKPLGPQELASLVENALV